MCLVVAVSACQIDTSYCGFVSVGNTSAALTYFLWIIWLAVCAFCDAWFEAYNAQDSVATMTNVFGNLQYREK